MQNGNNYKAEIFVPVWTSQLFVSDWWEQAEMPIKASVVADGNNWSVSVRNQLTRPVTHIEIVINNRLVDLGELAAGQSKQYKVTRDQGTPIGEYVWQHGGNFQNVMNSRQHAFGSSGSGRIVDLPNATTAASFISKMSQQQGHFEFLTPPGLDLSPSLDQGNAVILAWSSDYSPIRDINRFSPRRSHKDTLWRMTVPVITPTS
jgi:hypothetical protein